MTTESQPVLEEPVDPILIEIEKEDAERPKKTAKEPTRPYPFRRCNWWGHVWGVATEDSYSDTLIRRKVCVRGRGTVKGRCPAEQPRSVPIIDTDEEAQGPPEPQLPVFLLHDSEIERLEAHRWGLPAVRRRGVFIVRGVPYVAARGGVLEWEEDTA